MTKMPKIVKCLNLLILLSLVPALCFATITKQKLTPECYLVGKWLPVIAGGGFDLYETFDNYSSQYSGYIYNDWTVGEYGTGSDVNPNDTTAHTGFGKYVCKFIITDGASKYAYIDKAGFADTSPYIRFYMKIAVFPDSGTGDTLRRIFIAEDSDGTPFTRIVATAGAPSTTIWFQFFTDDTQPAGQWRNQAYDVGDNDWHYYEAHMNIAGSTVTWYVDGVQRAERTDICTSGCTTNIDNSDGYTFGMTWWSGADGNVTLYIDDIAIGDGTHSALIGNWNIASKLNDASDSTYVESDADHTAANNMMFSDVYNFSAPGSTANTLLMTKLWVKGKQYDDDDRVVNLGAWFDDLEGSGIYKYRYDSRYSFRDTFSWMAFPWHINGPKEYLDYDNQAVAEFAAGEQIVAGRFSEEAVVMVNDTVNDKLTITNRFGSGAGPTFTDNDEITGQTGLGTADVDGSVYWSALDWTVDATDFMAEIRPDKIPTIGDQIGGGGKVSEMYVELWTSSDGNDDYLTHGPIFGDCSATNLDIWGRTSGAADVLIAFGEVEQDVKDYGTTGPGAILADEVYYITAVTTSADDYTFQEAIANGATVKDAKDDTDHTYVFPAGTKLYFDIHVKGAGQAAYKSTYDLEYDDDTVCKNDFWSSLPSMTTYPAESDTTGFTFIFSGDSHSTVGDDIYHQINADSPKFFICPGDETDDIGDIYAGAREMHHGMRGYGRAAWLQDQIYSRMPYYRVLSDHDFGLNDSNKVGVGEYGDTLKYFRGYVGIEVATEQTPLPTYSSPADIEATADADSDADTLQDDSQDFSGVYPGMLVHKTTAGGEAYGIVKSVSGTTVELSGALVGVFGNTGESLSSAEYKIFRRGMWYSMRYGKLAEFFFTDQRSKRDPNGTPGADMLDGTRYGVDYKAGDPNAGEITINGLTITTNAADDPGDGGIVPGDVIWNETDDKWTLITGVVDNGTTFTLTLKDQIFDYLHDDWEVWEAGGSDHGSKAANEAAGHIQREWLLDAINNSVCKWKFIVGDLVYLHNEGYLGDKWADYDGLCFTDFANKNLRKGKVAYDNLTAGGDGAFNVGNVIRVKRGGVYTGAAGVIDAVAGGIITFETEYRSSTNWTDRLHQTLQGEIQDNDVLEEWTQNSGVPSTWPTLNAATGDTADANGADYNRYWEWNSIREYFQDNITFSNVVWLVADVHACGLDDGSHPADNFAQVLAAPSSYRNTFTNGSWFVGTDAAFLGKWNTRQRWYGWDFTSSPVYAGGYAAITVSSASLTATIYDGEGNAVTAATHGVPNDMTMTLTGIDEWPAGHWGLTDGGMTNTGMTRGLAR